VESDAVAPALKAKPAICVEETPMATAVQGKGKQPARSQKREDKPSKRKAAQMPLFNAPEQLNKPTKRDNPDTPVSASKPRGKK
jgi:hypothetical protein